MIEDVQELNPGMKRIVRFHMQVAHPRRNETNPANYQGPASGFLAEIDRMQIEVRERLCSLPIELAIR